VIQGSTLPWLVNRLRLRSPDPGEERLRLEMLQAEWAAVLAQRDARVAPDDAIRRVIRTLDIEEAMLDRPIQAVADSGEVLVTLERLKQTLEHFRQTGHPVMRSVEPGEAWRWCYLDEILGYASIWRLPYSKGSAVSRLVTGSRVLV